MGERLILAGLSRFMIYAVIFVVFAIGSFDYWGFRTCSTFFFVC